MWDGVKWYNLKLLSQLTWGFIWFFSVVERVFDSLSVGIKDPMSRWYQLIQKICCDDSLILHFEVTILGEMLVLSYSLGYSILPCYMMTWDRDINFFPIFWYNDRFKTFHFNLIDNKIASSEFSDREE